MNRPNVERCRNLRKNQTDTEKKLWSILRNRQSQDPEFGLAGLKFRRQFSIGRYILDFYSPKRRLGIEADGGQHYEDEGKRRDDQRIKELSPLGVKILRFSDRDILNNLEGVCRVILETIESKKVTPSPLVLSPSGERR